MLVEREAQLGVLHQAVAASTGQLVLIAAEAGAGKTTLVQALIEQTRRRVMLGGCDSLRTARPFGPLLDWAADIDPGLVDAIRAGAAQVEILERAFDLLGREPAIAVIEDAHWADSATADLLLFVGRRISRTPSTLMVTYRPDDVSPGSPLALTLGDLATTGPTRVSVPPLSRAGVSLLAAGNGLDPDVLFQRTEGNPFFVTECLVSPDEVPGTVRDAILARLHRLDQTAIAAAEAVSTFPGPVALDVVQTLTGNVEGADRAIDDGLLVLDGHTVRFRHELARRAVSAATRASERQRLHRLALDLVERNHPLDEAMAVHHALEAGDAAGLARHAGPAAHQAEAAGARREAIAHLDLALRVTAGDHARADLLTRLGVLCDETGEFDRAVAAFDAAADLTSDDRSRALIQLKSWNPLSMAGRLDLAAARLDRAITILEPLPAGPELALAWAQRCSLLMLSRRLREAEPWGAKALELAARCDDHATLAYVQIQSGTALFMSGDVAGYERVRAGIEMARRHGIERLVAYGLSQFGCGGAEMRAYDLAVPVLKECVEYAADRGLHSRGLYSHAWLGRCQVELGEWTQATSTLSAVLGSPRCTGVTRITALTALGRLRARRGDPDPWSLLDEALERARGTGQLQRLWPVAAARAEAAWLAGDVDPELGLVSSVLAQARELDQPWATGELAVWARRGGFPAVDSDDVAEPYAWELAGRAGEAARAWRSLGCSYDAALALAHSDVDADQRAALVAWKAAGAGRAVARLTEIRRAAGRAVPRGPNAATLRHAAGLTSRELEVLELVAAGHSNREIGLRTHLSAKTVGHHVSHILAKLEVANRTEAVRAALDLGIGTKR